MVNEILQWLAIAVLFAWIYSVRNRAAVAAGVAECAFNYGKGNHNALMSVSELAQLTHANLVQLLQATRSDVKSLQDQINTINRALGERN